MAAVDVGSRHAPPVQTDDLDDLFNYDVPTDMFRDVEANMDVSIGTTSKNGEDAKENLGGLGVDEAIKVTKKRAPIPKLDEGRLLSQAGIPKLRRMARERLKFKGKGHEYSDVARILNMYQLWLDDLYPRAKFADGLAIIEKLGHSKRMVAMRKEWINEGKPRTTLEDPGKDVAHDDPFSAREAPVAVSNLSKDASGETTQSSTTDERADDRRTLPSADEETDKRHDLEKSPQDENLPSLDNAHLVKPDDDQPDMDDLDALIAEDDLRYRFSDLAQGSESNTNFDDDMEAMASLDDMW